MIEDVSRRSGNTQSSLQSQGQGLGGLDLHADSYVSDSIASGPNGMGDSRTQLLGASPPGMRSGADQQLNTPRTMAAQALAKQAHKITECRLIETAPIYGYEDADDQECMICYDRTKNVLPLPCRHSSICHVCLRSLRDEKCPICRAVFTSYVAFPGQA